jgi:hypothetical protein
LGGAGGPVGDAFSDEADTQYGGRFNRSSTPFIYWHPETRRQCRLGIDRRDVGRARTTSINCSIPAPWLAGERPY